MRLIDADTLMETIKTHDYPLRDYFNSTDRGMFTSGIKQAVDEQPTIDAVEVKHGEWVEKWRFKPNGIPYHKVGDMECSVCHSDMLGRYYSRYCPHCGARMKGEQE